MKTFMYSIVPMFMHSYNLIISQCYAESSFFFYSLSHVIYSVTIWRLTEKIHILWKRSKIKIVEKENIQDIFHDTLSFLLEKKIKERK